MNQFAEIMDLAANIGLVMAFLLFFVKSPHSIVNSNEIEVDE